MIQWLFMNQVVIHSWKDSEQIIVIVQRKKPVFHFSGQTSEVVPNSRAYCPVMPPHIKLHFHGNALSALFSTDRKPAGTNKKHPPTSGYFCCVEYTT